MIWRQLLRNTTTKTVEYKEDCSVPTKDIWVSIPYRYYKNNGMVTIQT